MVWWWYISLRANWFKVGRRLRRLPALNQHLINVSCFLVVSLSGSSTGYIPDTQYCHDVRIYCWVIVFDDGTTLNQYWLIIGSDQRCVFHWIHDSIWSFTIKLHTQWLYSTTSRWLLLTVIKNCQQLHSEPLLLCCTTSAEIVSNKKSREDWLTPVLENWHIVLFVIWKLELLTQ